MVLVYCVMGKFRFVMVIVVYLLWKYFYWFGFGKGVVDVKEVVVKVV